MRIISVQPFHFANEATDRRSNQFKDTLRAFNSSGNGLRSLDSQPSHLPTTCHSIQKKNVGAGK